MAKTIVGLYDDFATAQQVVQDLLDAGFADEDVSIVANDTAGDLSRQRTVSKEDDSTLGTGTGVGAGTGAAIGGIGGLLIGLGALAIPGIGPVVAAGPIVAALVGAGVGAVVGGLVGALVDMGVPEEDAHYYAEGVRQGGTLVTVSTPDHMVDEAVMIMERHHPVDIDERGSTWRETGWSGPEVSTTAATSAAPQREFTPTHREPSEANLDVVEEELVVGKRPVERDSVRVRSYITERPVEETVRLREEHAHVERRRVDRPAADADLDAFEEGEIEITTTREEPVVTKKARVVEEVVVNKDVQERNETIRDTVRRKDVEVEGAEGEAGTTDYRHADDLDFRTHYNSYYTNSNYTYDEYVPAYRYGYGLTNDARYQNRDWTDIEPDIRRSWEQRNPGTWEQFKDAVRHGWEQTKASIRS